MANYWAIAIGINQYQFFQPLRCAQADAEALNDFLVQEAGFAPQRCLLMTDTSAPIGDRSTYPTKDNILLLLEDLAAACWQPQDHLWLFFSGYGVNYEGKDYLMPVGGDPERVVETAIEMRSLMQSLQLAQLNVLLLLDINRAFGTQSNAPVGQETAELAQELQLPTILSCQAEQFSHESSELGHGFFTAALLQALRSGHGSSLANLESYLSILTPELCQNYWRPTQNPVTINSSTGQAILPQFGHKNEVVPSTIQPSEVIPNTLEANEVEPVIFPEENFAVVLTAPSLEAKPDSNSAKSPKIGIWEDATAVETTINPKSAQLPPPNQTSAIPSLREAFLPDASPTPTASFTNAQSEAQQLSESASDLDSPETDFNVPTGGRYLPNVPQPYISPLPPSEEPPIWKQFLIWGGGTLLIVALISVVLLRNQARLLKVRQISPDLPTSVPSDSQMITSAPDTRSISDKPPLNPPKNPATAQIAPNSEPNKQNQAVLDLAKKSLKQNQASDLSVAIATARKIQPGEPLYQQAQENIRIWSQMILDLAASRAKQRQYADAIAAAQLITPNEALYPKAQAAIKQWQLEAKQYVGNKTLLDAANALIRPGQASSYNRAIEVAKRVPQGQPGFDLAQTAINTWSETILDLAKNRANQGDYQAAIATAALVPDVTPVYEDAQAAIQKWSMVNGQ